MKYRIALPAAAVTTLALTLTPAMASATQRPGPPSQGSITYSESCHRNTCTAEVTEVSPAFSPLVFRPVRYEFVALDPHRIPCAANLSVSVWGRHGGGVVPDLGWSRDLRRTKVFRETLTGLGADTQRTVTVTTTARHGEVPIVVEGLNPIR